MAPDTARPTVSIVIPIHNEAGFLAGALLELVRQLDDVPADCTVVLVENGSTDATRQVANDLAATLPGVEVRTHPEPDYGGAMRAGFLAATTDWVVNFDIDYFSGAFLGTALATQEADIVIGSKRVAGSQDRRSPLRRVGTWGFNLLLRLLFGSAVSDTHGMKAFRGGLVRDLAPAVLSRQDLFDTELVLRAERTGRRIVDVPVVVEELREARSSFVKRIPRTLRGLLQLRAALRRERRNTTSR